MIEAVVDELADLVDVGASDVQMVADRLIVVGIVGFSVVANQVKGFE